MMYKLRLDVKVSIISDLNIILSKKKLNFSERNSSKFSAFMILDLIIVFFREHTQIQIFLLKLKKIR